MSNDLQTTISAHEQRRCEALVGNDLQALRNLISEDLVHIHANGKSEDRDGYLTTVGEHIEFISVERVNLLVRACGDAAVATGELKQRIRLRATGQVIDMRAITTQVWRLSAAQQWQQTTFQATHIV